MQKFENGMSEDARRERLHRHMNNEMGALEIAAQCLADFPESPWDLRMQLARQAFDESRHVHGLHQRLRQLGGYKGEFPIGNRSEERRVGKECRSGWVGGGCTMRLGGRLIAE